METTKRDTHEMPSLGTDPYVANDPYANPRATIDAVHAVVMSHGDDVNAVNPKAHLNSSGFNSGEMAQARKALLPTVWGGSSPSGEFSSAPADDSTAAPVDPALEGQVAAEELTGRDIWRAIQAPIQSTEGNRSGELYARVINQFAVGTNPRYAPDAPDKGRGHIFVWDVTRAMNVEVPHFAGGRGSFSLVQTMDWLRNEGMSRGWVKMGLGRAIEAAAQGSPVLVLPKSMKIRQLAVLRPEGLAADRQPRVAAAGKAQGNSLTFLQAIGEMNIECFMHP